MTNLKLNNQRRFDPGGSRNLDILRMIAVSLVVQDHLFTFWGNPTYWHNNIVPLRLGRFGVVLFFVHTALVLMASMERQWNKTGRRRFISIFLIRRGFRIYPLAAAALLLFLVFSIPGQIGIGEVRFVTYTHANVWANFTMVQNVAGGPDSSILSPMWSLAFEWQMYMVLPLFYFLCRRASSIIPLIAIWSIPVLIGIAYSSQINDANNYHAFWKIPDWGTWGPCFIAGIMAFFIASKLKPAPALPWPAIPLAIAAMAFPMMATDRFTKFIPASLLLAVLIPYCREIPHGWFSSFARIVVRYSYGIYLFHMLGIYLAFVKLSAHAHLTQWLAFVAIAIVVPVFFYHALEHPAIRLGNAIAKRLEPQPMRSRPVKAV